MPIVWLASYPKSGNTWLRFLLYNYLYGEVQQSEDVNRRIPDLHVAGPDGITDPGGGSPLLVKTHFLLSPALPQINQTAAFIHVVRHPKDVLLSNLNCGELPEEAFCTEFINLMGVKHWREMGMGSWVEHTASWLAGATTLPHLLLRYEQMKADPGAAMEQVVRFLELPVEPDKIDRAVAASSFDSMKKLEQKERDSGTRSKVFSIQEGEAAKTGSRFLNRGKSGQDLTHISPELDAAFNNRFASVLEMLGYA